ncbi:MAG: NAD(P)-dependent oxidoreductase [Deltaproteobacteria bacterium]|nr:NAD(P)-dependent oxidoreductase [Candidatus Deferrimicrobium borealis]
MGAVIVTGASGFIGNATARALCRKDCHVICIHFPHASARDIPGAESLIADLSAPQTWEQLCTYRPEAVLHIAAAVPASFEREATILAATANRIIDRQVISFCEKVGARLVYASSTSVSRIDGDYKDNAYALQKAETEDLIDRAHLKSKCSLRINSPYGPGQVLRTVLKLFVEAAINNEPLYYFGTGSRTQDFIHVEDVASAIIAAYETHATGIFNVATGISVSMKDLAHLVVSLVPGCTSQVLSAGKDDPDENYRAEYDISATTKYLNWRPIYSLQEGITDMLKPLRPAR